MFILLGALTFAMLVPKPREQFQVDMNISSRTLYRTSRNFDSEVGSLSTVLSDRDDAFTMAGCFQFKADKDPRDYLPQDCYINDFGMYTNSFDELRDRVMITLQNLSISTIKDKIAGEALVLVSQSPYMRDNNGNVIAVQYNISSYNFEPKVGSNLSETPLFFRVYIMLPSYDRNLVRKNAPSSIMPFLSTYRTNKDQCYVKCVNDTTGSYCGCLNTKKVNNLANSYSSSCSSTPDLSGDTNKSINIPANFAVMYKVNPLAQVVAEAGIFDR